MKYANEALFLVFSLILSGLFVSSIPFIRKNNLTNCTPYWLVALSSNIVAFLSFASASTISGFLLTIANTFFFTGYFFLALFCRALNKKPTQKFSRIFPILFLLFAASFEYLRQSGTFQIRVFFVVIALLACLVWMMVELILLRKKEQRIQLDFLMFTTFAELILGLIRLWLVLFNTTSGNFNLYEEPFASTLLRWFSVSFTVLSYVSIVGYWAEGLSYENQKNIQDNKRINELLQEREALIANLLKANKTAATGALSASIAHELNQPLGASNLNIQFLRRKLENGLFSSDIGKEVLDALEADNNRAATIVRSLRSIFTEGDYQTQEYDLANLISNVLDIVKPELKAKQIQIQLRLQDGLLVRIRSGEIEQVILNLLNNAIQSLSSSETSLRTIVIEAQRVKGSVSFSICDNGQGVPDQFKKNLFELLNTTKQSGMGLGLWLCKHIITRYDGLIWHEDVPSGGAQFCFKLPIAT